MKNAADIIATHRRLEILRLLSEAAGYSCNEALIVDILHQSGYLASSDIRPVAKVIYCHFISYFE